MTASTCTTVTPSSLPEWLPEAAKTYLIHTEWGISIRQLAQARGCHPSTVLRQIRKTESRRDDPLIDLALGRIGAGRREPRDDHLQGKDCGLMTADVNAKTQRIPDRALEREARRILRRLNEPGACLAVARDMEKAVVVRETEDGRTVRTAVVASELAQAMAVKDWIACGARGRISRYRITAAGRAALKRLLAEDEQQRAELSEEGAVFAGQHGAFEEREVTDPNGGRRRVRYNAAESPVAAMARRRGRDGKPFLSAELVAAAERLREDFELAQMGPRVAQNWDRFLTGGERGGFNPGAGVAEGPEAARARVAEALRELGPGLGDVALRVCCFLEGLETAEKRMGWSARSGKIVLRIALQRLRRHYAANGHGGGLIG